MTANTTNDYNGQIVYFSHGGGPLPVLGDKSHRAMVEFLEQLPASLNRPEAIIVISAHWEESMATVLGSSSPDLYYDYYGFPDESYKIQYPAPGHPQLAARIVALLEEKGISAAIDSERGFDHGLFIPLKLIYPMADIPSIQISLVEGLNPSSHVELGKALAPLMNENILVVGSGFSFHNMGQFLWEENCSPDQANDAFQDWLIETCTSTMAPSERERRLLQWTDAPSARYCHPREEHLLPLHVCLGMAGARAAVAKIFDDYILGKRAVAFRW